jgi:heptosyltransferase-2
MTEILIVKFGSLGDVVRTSYILPGLDRKYDRPAIHWLTSAESFDLLRFNPYVSDLHMNAPDKALLETPFDLIISLDDEEEVLSLIEDVPCRRWSGAFYRGGKPSYTEESSEWFDMGLISHFGKEKADELKKANRREHHRILADMLDIEIEGPLFYNSTFIEDRMSRLFSPDYFNIGVNSGAGSRWHSKQLEMDETVALIERLLQTDMKGRQARVYLLGGRDEAGRHATIKGAISSERLIDPGVGHSLLEFAAIVRCCDYVITSDSLALHLAISQNVRNLSFYAPTSAAEIGTFGTGVKVTSLSDDYCSYRKEADNSSITSERIFHAMKEHVDFR